MLKSRCGWAADVLACAAHLQHWWVMALHCMVWCDGNGTSVDIGCVALLKSCCGWAVDMSAHALCSWHW